MQDLMKREGCEFLCVDPRLELYANRNRETKAQSH